MLTLTHNSLIFRYSKIQHFYVYSFKQIFLLKNIFSEESNHNSFIFRPPSNIKIAIKKNLKKLRYIFDIEV